MMGVHKLIFGTGLWFVLMATGCAKNQGPFDPRRELERPDIAIKWADMTLKTFLYSGNNSPIYASRTLGYMGLTMYETLVHGSATHRTLAGQLNGLGSLPLPETGMEYDWVLAMNAGQAWMLKKMFYQAGNDKFASIDSLENAIYDRQTSGDADAGVYDRSVAYGRAVADAIYTWSLSDNGAYAYLEPYDVNYVFPTGTGYWVPPFQGQGNIPLPMGPYWGSTRTFLEADAQLALPVMIAPYSSDPSSEYYRKFKEVYNIHERLTRSQKETAAWWGDDPAGSYSPPGHSYNISSLILRKKRPDLFTAAEVYARTGMALADAFICCWKVKFAYHSERPFGYIQKNIDPGYVQFWPEPPFPAFTSGHSTQISAAATVLAGVFGNAVSFVDNTNTFRPYDPIRDVSYKKSRSFTSLTQMAEECGYSRLLGGIHTREDNENGLAMGKEIGNHINALLWRK